MLCHKKNNLCCLKRHVYSFNQTVQIILDAYNLPDCSRVLDSVFSNNPHHFWLLCCNLNTFPEECSSCPVVISPKRAGLLSGPAERLLDSFGASLFAHESERLEQLSVIPAASDGARSTGGQRHWHGSTFSSFESKVKPQ